MKFNLNKDIFSHNNGPFEKPKCTPVWETLLYIFQSQSQFSRHYPLDFFLWDYVKNKVHCTLVCDISTLIARISEAIESVVLEMLQNT